MPLTLPRSKSKTFKCSSLVYSHLKTSPIVGRGRINFAKWIYWPEREAEKGGDNTMCGHSSDCPSDPEKESWVPEEKEQTEREIKGGVEGRI